MVGVSPRAVEQASAVIRKGIPELDHAVERGEISVSKAAKIAALPKLDQAAVLENPKPAEAAPPAEPQTARAQMLAARPPGAVSEDEAKFVHRCTADLTAWNQLLRKRRLRPPSQERILEVIRGLARTVKGESQCPRRRRRKAG
jgi:hypothetical protein